MRTHTHIHTCSSPEGHDELSLGVDSDGEVADLSLAPHPTLTCGAVHVPPEPGVVLQLLSRVKLSTVTDTGLLGEGEEGEGGRGKGRRGEGGRGEVEGEEGGGGRGQGRRGEGGGGRWKGRRG